MAPHSPFRKLVWLLSTVWGRGPGQRLGASFPKNTTLLLPTTLLPQASGSLAEHSPLQLWEESVHLPTRRPSLISLMNFGFCKRSEGPLTKSSSATVPPPSKQESTKSTHLLAMERRVTHRKHPHRCFLDLASRVSLFSGMQSTQPLNLNSLRTMLL